MASVNKSAENMCIIYFKIVIGAEARANKYATEIRDTFSL